MKTQFPTNEEALANRRWYIVDAEQQVVGRLATKVASLLRGKDNPQFTPHNDSGDFVVVINAEKVRFTGAKKQDKKYYRHTGYIGALKEETAAEVFEKHPDRIIKRAVKGMLPRTNLGKAQLEKLKVYIGAEHPHQAQNPEPVTLG